MSLLILCLYHATIQSQIQQPDELLNAQTVSPHTLPGVVVGGTDRAESLTAWEQHRDTIKHYSLLSSARVRARGLAGEGQEGGGGIAHKVHEESGGHLWIWMTAMCYWLCNAN